MTRRRRVLFVLTTVALVFVVIVVALEVGLRLFGVRPDSISPLKDFHQLDQVLGFRGRPGLDARWTRPEFSVRILHDDRGFRAHRNAGPPSADAPAIHVFGDSFTWGWGVDHGEVYTDRLSALRRNHHVRNWGRNGSGTATQYHEFADACRDGLRAHDIVLLAFYTNDFADCFDDRQVHVTTVSDGVLELRPAVRHRNWNNAERWWKEHSVLYSWIAHGIAYRRQARRNREARGVVPELRGSELGARYYRAVEFCLRRFRDDCAAKGARFVVLSIPEATEMAGRGAAIPARRALAAICASLTIPLVDPTDALRRINETKPAYIHADGHWTAAAHREVAFVLAESIL